MQIDACEVYGDHFRLISTDIARFDTVFSPGRTSQSVELDETMSVQQEERSRRVEALRRGGVPFLLADGGSGLFVTYKQPRHPLWQRFSTLRCDAILWIGHTAHLDFSVISGKAYRYCFSSRQLLVSCFR